MLNLWNVIFGFCVVFIDVYEDKVWVLVVVSDGDWIVIGGIDVFMVLWKDFMLSIIVDAAKKYVFVVERE